MNPLYINYKMSKKNQVNRVHEYNIKKQEEQAKSDADGTSEIDDETIERHINENERIEEEKAKALYLQ